MPTAFSFAYGLDLETEVSSFWSWFRDASEVVQGTGEGSKQVRELVEAQREKIEKISRSEAAPASAKFALTMAIALVGFHHASNQKLLNDLQDYGLLEPPAQPGQPVFDTITEPPFERNIKCALGGVTDRLIRGPVPVLVLRPVGEVGQRLQPLMNA